MKRAYFNCILLDGTEQMEPVAHKMVLVDGEKPTSDEYCQGGFSNETVNTLRTSRICKDFQAKRT